MELNWWPVCPHPQDDCLKVDQKAEGRGRFAGTAEGSRARTSLWMKAVRKEWVPASTRFLVAAVQAGKKYLGLWTIK